MVNFLPEHFLGGESAFGANRLGIIFTIAYSRLGVSGKSGASGKTPLLRFSQIKWLIVVVGSPLALLVMWQIYQMIAVQWETAHCELWEQIRVALRVMWEISYLSAASLEMCYQQNTSRLKVRNWGWFYWIAFFTVILTPSPTTVQEENTHLVCGGYLRPQDAIFAGTLKPNFSIEIVCRKASGLKNFVDRVLILCGCGCGSTLVARHFNSGRHRHSQQHSPCDGTD